MNKHPIGIAAGVALLALSPAIALSADSTNADTILKKMSKKLAAAEQFTFKGTREVHAPTATGEKLHAKSEVEVIVQRPNHAFAQATNAEGVQRMYCDGKTFTLYIEEDNIYSTVPMEVSLDDLPAELAKQYGFTPPLADFTTSNPYEDLKFRTQAISYAGKSLVGNPPVECHRLELSGTHADSELWLAVADSLPRKMTAFVKDGPGAGTDLTIEFVHWDLKASVTGKTFNFTPPPEAHHTRMITMEEMEAAAQTE